ncbi:MAG: response regulator [Polyangiaceae bacterium]
MRANPGLKSDGSGVKPMSQIPPWLILVVDDSATARAQLRVTLEAKGARVLEAENGREGLWRARSERVDMIFSDLHMPVMDGLHMIQELRKDAAYLTTPILVLTSDAAVTRAAEGKKAGANAWITKPINPELLWKAVEKALFGRQPASVANGVAPLAPALRGSK